MKRLGWARLLLILTSCATPGRLFNFQYLEVIDKFQVVTGVSGCVHFTLKNIICHEKYIGT